MSRLTPKQQWSFAFAGIALTLLLGAVFTFGSLAVPFEPKNWRALLALYAVSSFITAALLIFLLILGRTLFRLWVERSKDQLGARFKTKMLVGAMAISLLPVLFMFFVSYSLLNRTLGRWFPRPLEIASEQTQILLSDFGRTQIPRLHNLAHQLEPLTTKPLHELLAHAVIGGADAVWLLDKNGKPLTGGVLCDDPPEVRDESTCVRPMFWASSCAFCPAASKCGTLPELLLCRTHSAFPCDRCARNQSELNQSECRELQPCELQRGAISCFPRHRLSHQPVIL